MAPDQDKPQESPAAPNAPTTDTNPTTSGVIGSTIQPTGAVNISSPVEPISAPPVATVNTTDPTQIGYVPPANPLPSSEIPAQPGKLSGKAGKVRLIVGIAIGVALLTGGGALIKDLLFSGSAIKSGDLTEITVENVTFKHPKQWTKVEEPTALAAFAEGGKKLDEADQGLLVMSENLGTDYDALTAEQKDMVYDRLEEGFTGAGVIDEDVCKDASPVTVAKASQPNYTSSISIGYTCNEIAGRTVKGEVKAVIGLKGEEMHMVIIVAIDKTWDKSGSVLNEILNSFKPA